MDQKKSPLRRTKRQAKTPEDNQWDCSVCTFRNTAEAFKCLMCDVRKGTSTRKPRINPQLVAQQVAQQTFTSGGAAAAGVGAANHSLNNSFKGHHHHHHKNSSRTGGGPAARMVKKRRHPPRLKNVDRSSAQTREVTVNSVTVVITEYKPKQPSKDNNSISSSSSEHSESSSTDAR